MKIKLNSLLIENFKGIKKFSVDFANRTVITAENGVGKTTIYDAFLWLLFDKDSTGRKDFDLRPLDESNQPIKGLVLAVQAELEIDGSIHIFKKEHHERIVKNEFKGYEASCYIDEVPKKVGEYSDYIEEIIPEDTFKMLTNLRHFNEGLHWKERREVLLDIAGEIGTPDGFDELLAALNGRSIEDYKKVLAGQKERLKKDRDEINPRIDEIQNGLKEYAGTDRKKLEKKRSEIQEALTSLNQSQKIMLKGETERQAKLKIVNDLKLKQKEREIELKNDLGNTTALLEEKAEIEKKVAACKQDLSKEQNALSLIKMQLKGKQAELEQNTESLESVRKEAKTIMDSKDPDICFNCNQKLPPAMVKKSEEKKNAALAIIAKRGNAMKTNVESCTEAIELLEVEIDKADRLIATAESALQKAEQAKEERFAQIDAEIQHRKPRPPTADGTWQDIGIKILHAEKELGEPVADQLQTIESQRTLRQNELNEVNKSLAQADRAKQDKARIDELEQQEKDLAQKIADIDKQLADISNYNMAESKLIEDSVNKKFKHVKFKLFEYLLNGEINPCCEATLNGVPYGDMSYGQKIFIGIDIINVLSVHYEISVPLWIDNAEGLTLPVEFEGQTIQLFAQKGISILTVEKSETAEPVKTTKSTSKKKEGLFV